MNYLPLMKKDMHERRPNMTMILWKMQDGSPRLARLVLVSVGL